MPPEQYCESCGAELPYGGYPCPECGRDQSSGKSAGLAALLSLLLTGAGHFYLGRVARGAGWLGGGIAFGAIVGALAPEAFFLAFLVPVASAIDAYVQADTTAPSTA